jgi:tetratricopeptide (TPR) repeat protein
MGRATELEPKAMPPTAGMAGYLGVCLHREGRGSEAREQFLLGLGALERTDHMYRDTWRALFLCGLGHTALDQGDRAAATAAFQQAELHLRGRPMARCSGQVMVQALAGLARADDRHEVFDEALRRFDTRSGFDFSAIWGAYDGMALWELHLAAAALGRTELATALLERARAAGSTQAHRVR